MKIIRKELIQAHVPEYVSIRCTFGDVLLRNLPVSVVFFYDYELDADSLAHALGKILGDFCIFNAVLRYKKGELMLDCGNQGVSFSVVKRDCTLLQTIKGLKAERSNLIEIIDTSRVFAKSQPILTVRISHFADGGSCLGVCWHHSIGDFHSFMCLMKAWSQSAMDQAHIRPMVVDDRNQYLLDHLERNNCKQPALRYLRLIELARLGMYMLREARDQQSLSFYFTSQELENIRQALRRESGESLSVNDALCAHMFCAIVAGDGPKMERGLSIGVNYRARVGLPDTLLGNMTTMLNTRVEIGKPAFAVARELRDGLREFDDERMDYLATLDFVQEHGGTKTPSRFVPIGIDPVNKTLLITSWTKFGVYNISFGRKPPMFFTGVGEVPFPWLSSVFEGFSNQGAIFAAVVPRALAQSLVRGDVVRQIHRYRETNAELPELAHVLGVW